MRIFIKLIFLFNLVPFQFHSLAQNQKFSIGWSRNIETYFIAERLAVQTIGNYVFDNKGTDYSHQPMVTEAYRTFEPYKDNATILGAAKIMEQIRDKMYDNSPILDYLLHQNEFPAQGADTNYNDWGDVGNKVHNEIKPVLKELTDSLRAFYIQADVDRFLKKYQLFYEGAVSEVKKDIDPKIYPTIENYFGEKFGNYRILISPTMPIPYGEDNYRGMGIKLKAKNGETAAMVMSTNVNVPTQNGNFYYTSFGFDNPRITQFLAVHETLHSFVNPPLYHFKNLIVRDSLLFTPKLAEYMRPQGIQTWEDCLIEHFVRLSEIRIATKMGNENQAEMLRKMHTDTFHFVLLPFLEKKIKKYETNRKKFPQFKNFLPVILKEIHALKPETIDSLISSKK